MTLFRPEEAHIRVTCGRSQQRRDRPGDQGRRGPREHLPRLRTHARGTRSRPRAERHAHRARRGRRRRDDVRRRCRTEQDASPTPAPKPRRRARRRNTPRSGDHGELPRRRRHGERHQGLPRRRNDARSERRHDHGHDRVHGQGGRVQGLRRDARTRRTAGRPGIRSHDHRVGRIPQHHHRLHAHRTACATRARKARRAGSRPNTPRTANRRSNEGQATVEGFRFYKAGATTLTVSEETTGHEGSGTFTLSAGAFRRFNVVPLGARGGLPGIALPGFAFASNLAGPMRPALEGGLFEPEAGSTFEVGITAWDEWDNPITTYTRTRRLRYTGAESSPSGIAPEYSATTEPTFNAGEARGRWLPLLQGRDDDPARERRRQRARRQRHVHRQARRRREPLARVQPGRSDRRHGRRTHDQGARRVRQPRDDHIRERRAHAHVRRRRERCRRAASRR